MPERLHDNLLAAGSNPAPHQRVAQSGRAVEKRLSTPCRRPLT